jgi:hypothetical protein
MASQIKVLVVQRIVNNEISRPPAYHPGARTTAQSLWGAV